jgi:hypothetical protein
LRFNTIALRRGDCAAGQSLLRWMDFHHQRTALGVSGRNHEVRLVKLA